MNDKVRHTVLPILTALIWGTAFSAQSICSAHVGPFTLNAWRGAIAFLLLLLLCLLRKGHREWKWKDLLLGGLCCGTALFLASNLQQLGIATTSAGKTGFITALYIVIVPVCGVFFHKKFIAAYKRTDKLVVSRTKTGQPFCRGVNIVSLRNKRYDLAANKIARILCVAVGRVLPVGNSFGCEIL